MNGFKNLGNTCYMNAGLQMLIQNKKLYKLLKFYSKYSDKLGQIYNFFSEYHHTTNISVLNPKMIKDLVSNRHHDLAGFGQEDTSEFIIYFLDIIDDELKLLNKHINLKQLFNVISITRTKCKTCENKSFREDDSYYLLLNLSHDSNQDNRDLDSLYKDYKSKELLEGDNMYSCEKCKTKRVASKRMCVKTWPDDLFIWLKRFDMNLRKISKSIEIPLIWRDDYQLQGAIIHSGNLNGGHYYYLGKVKENWYIFDDTSVSKIESIERVKGIIQQAYWLYYKKLIVL